MSSTVIQRASRRDLTVLLHQIRYEQLTFWRNPQSAFFTFVLPVVVIAVFGLMFDGTTPSPYFGGLSALQYYVTTLAAMSVLGSCYSQLAIVLSTRRQNGILKRVRATPLPPWMYFVGLLAHCVMVSIVDVLLIVGVGRLYNVPIPSAAAWLPVAVTLVLGSASFCALGFAVASLIRNAEAAPAVVQFILFPLVFMSGTYMPVHNAILENLTGVLPVRPFNQALLQAIGPDGGFAWRHLLVLVLWGVLGAAVAVRRFRWDPRPE
ncbi:ABC transporter permease [Streptomyces sp. A73]|uniref:ABC transporter permease n=1 Tax=Streptomyces sp. RK75 TaxID=2824895 RepID=UPI000C19E42E|nr:ABC transporter permease [Streptomyces sp. RK75]MBQ0866976.1 ABC transporter permease [Streptomyces sp. RK75]MBQ1163034.1 ABC transporter permease [Streptomyces sp. A73]